MSSEKRKKGEQVLGLGDRSWDLNREVREVEHTGEAQYSSVTDLLRELLHQEVVIDAVEEFLQVHVHHKPATFGDILLGRLDRLMGVPPRSKAVAGFGEVRLEDR